MQVTNLLSTILYNCYLLILIDGVSKLLNNKQKDVPPVNPEESFMLISKSSSKFINYCSFIFLNSFIINSIL